MRFRAIEIAKSLTKEEVKKFKIFVNSSCYNTHKKVGQLADIFFKFYPDFNSQKLTHKFIQEKLSVHDSRLNDLFSELNKLLEEFLIHLYINDKTRIVKLKQLYLLDELKSRSLHDRFDKKKKEYIKFLNDPKSGFENTDLFFRYIFNIHNYDVYCFSENTNLSEKHDEIIRLQNKIGNAFTGYYIMESLRDFIQFKWQTDIMDEKDVKNINPVLRTYFDEDEKTDHLFREMIEEETIEHVKLVMRVYYLIYRSYKNDYKPEERVKDLTEVIDLVSKLPGKVSSGDLHYILNQARNIVMRFIDFNPSYRHLKYEINDAYLFALSSDSDLKIPFFLFVSLIIDAFIEGRIDWASIVIKEYGDHLDVNEPEHKEYISKFISMFELMIDNNCSDALKIISTLKPFNLNNKADIKFIEICLQYDAGNYKNVSGLIENFRKFAKNNSTYLPAVKVDRIKLFCKLIKILSTASNALMEERSLKSRKQKVSEIKYQVEKETKNGYNHFIQTKLEEMEKEFC